MMLWMVGAMAFVASGCCVGVMALLFLQKKQNKEREQEILAALTEGVILCDVQGIIRAISPAAKKILELPKKKFLGSVFFQAGDGVDPVLFDKCCQILRKTMKTGDAQTLSFCVDREQLRCYDLKTRALRGGNEVILSLRDHITDQNLQQQGRNFIANAAHELRTPITIIKGFAETMMDLPKISEAMLCDFIEKIGRNCQRMENLVKNLLILADLDGFSVSRKQECDLVALIDSCVHTLLDTHEEAEVETWYNRDIITIFGDPDLLELAITNVLENGVKYSASTPTVKITIEELPEQVRLSIADCGVGIPKEDLDHIFDRFYTVDKARSRKLGGAGLGLSIVETIMQKHGAQVGIDSKVGSGTTVTFRF